MSAPLEVPRLSVGERFVLRAWELTDLPLVEEASRDEYIPLISTVPSPYSRVAGEAFVRRQWGRVSAGSGYPFVIARAEDQHPVGAIGLWLRDLDEGRAWIGYWLAPSGRGHGAATESLRVVARWAVEDLHIPRLQLCVEPWNVASQRTAERAGFQREGLLRGWQQVGAERRDMLLYAMLDVDLPPAEAG
ncbi:GNAT family N-acetyltransferase [Myceligenerans indicum]|uniref:GNAT family N-acetyltransferase n=1 Tax=Myceligenerans indicum TaxID=2593663 RepID=A0ABS1LP43_9MICO|nr:GNAT family protein [Myceligenerans indicum]MBL0887784.1 GNAT family N-acetyltransferase [Myceligenerans indicum]